MRRIAIVLLLLSLARCGGAREPEPVASGPGREDGKTPSFDGVPIAYTVAGDGRGALVFVHGWSCDRHYWSAQIDAFADEQKVVAVDLAGHGDSGSERLDWTIESLGRDVKAVVDALGLETVVLIGHSMGGSVALEAARLMPERVVGVIAVDALHDVEYRDPAAWAAAIAELEADFATACRGFVAGMFLDDADQELVWEITADMCDAPPEIAIELLARLAVYDQAAALSVVSAPVRAINGSVEPTRIENNRRHDPDFDARIVVGAGHFLMLERPAELNGSLATIIEEMTAGATI